MGVEDVRQSVDGATMVSTPLDAETAKDRASVPNRVRCCGWLLAAFVVGAPAWAHEDSHFSLASDGTILEYPDSYRPASLSIEDGGEELEPRVTLSTGGSTLALPPCLAELFVQPPDMEPTLRGSWYHDLSTLPPYLVVDLPYERVLDTGEVHAHQFMFNMRTAELLEVRRVLSDGRNSLNRKLVLKELCSAEERAAVRRRPNAAGVGLLLGGSVMSLAGLALWIVFSRGERWDDTLSLTSRIGRLVLPGWPRGVGAWLLLGGLGTALLSLGVMPNFVLARHMHLGGIATIPLVAFAAAAVAVTLAGSWSESGKAVVLAIFFVVAGLVVTEVIEVKGYFFHWLAIGTVVLGVLLWRAWKAELATRAVELSIVASLVLVLPWLYFHAKELEGLWFFGFGAGLTLVALVSGAAVHLTTARLRHSIHGREWARAGLLLMALPVLATIFLSVVYVTTKLFY